MSDWEQYHFEERIREILNDQRYFRPDHHFGRPFLTPYQIAIEFSQRYPEDFEAIGLQVGGAGLGESNSLAQYIAGQLSRRINNESITDIEGGFISSLNLNDILFNNSGNEIRSSLSDTNYDLSIFRSIDN